VRLLMVHGGLSVYRISRLIKYSFYKNIAFAFMLLYYQFFSGWSGAPLDIQHGNKLRGSRFSASLCPSKQDVSFNAQMI